MTDQLAFTRDKFKAETAVRLGEALGTTTGGDPFTSDADIDFVVADICRRTDCYFWGGTSGPGAYGMEIVANKIDYCASPIYKIAAITAADETGNRWPLTIQTQREFDQMTGNWWRATGPGTTSNVQSNPWVAYLKGENSFGLYPVPSYSTLIYDYTDLVIAAGGTVSSALRPFTVGDIGSVITVTGGTGFTQTRFVILAVDASHNATVAGNIGTPGSTGGIGAFGTGGLSISGYGTPGPWPNPTDVCPLQSKNHQAVLHGLCLRRLLTARASRDKETRDIARDLMPEYRNLFEESLGDIEAESTTLSQHSERGFSYIG